jgi:hypothetical protein
MDLMREGICHGSFTLYCCFFSLLDPGKDFLHGIGATAPLHLVNKVKAKQTIVDSGS